MRQGRRPAAPVRRRLGHLAELGLRVEGQVAGDLPERARAEPRRGGDLRHPIAVRVPGQLRNGELQLLAQGRGHVHAFRAQRGQRPDRPAELQHEAPPPNLAHALAMPIDGRQPSRRLQPEGRGQRLLHPGSSHGRRRAVVPGEARQGARERRELVLDQREGLPQLQHEAGVDRVLAGGAPVDEAGRLRVVRGDLGLELVDERDRQVAGLRGSLRQGLGVEELGAALRGDGRGGAGGDHARLRFGARQRRLEVQHALEPRAVGEHLFEGVPAEQRVEQAHGAGPLLSQQSKKTVSPGPCRTTFHSSVPGFLRARRDQGRAALRLDEAQGEVVGVRGLVREVDPGDEPHQQAAREHRDHDVRRLGLPVRARHRLRA